MKIKSFTARCLTLLACLALPATMLNAKVASSDKSFVVKAAQGGMTEVEAGKLAQEKGSSQEVKDFGAMMVKDHSQNDSDLLALAKVKGITVPEKLDTAHQAEIDKLNAASGAAFDKAYIDAMVKGHTKMLKLMKSEQSSKDADFKDFAAKTSDTVQMHLGHAQEIQKTLK